MRIEVRHPATAAGSGRSARAGGPGGFSVGTDRTSSASGPRSAAGLASLDAILLLQGEEDPGERRRRSAGRAASLLDRLDDLKVSLLSGTVPVAQLRRIADALAADAGATGDPHLDELVAAVELRTRVELAKLGLA